MKKFLIAGSSLAAVAAAGSAGAVDVTLGGSIDMGVEFGVGKNKGSLAIGDAYNSISLSLAAAGTTDGGMKYGGSFTLSTAEELEFSLYGDDKKHFKYTVKNFTDLEAAVYDVSGGMHIPEENIVAVKINSSWRTVSNNTRTDYGYPVALSNDGVEYASTNICKIAGRVDLGAGLRIGDGTAWTVTRQTAGGDKIADFLPFINNDPEDGYLPAGRLQNPDPVVGVAVVNDGGFEGDGNANQVGFELTVAGPTSTNIFITDAADDTDTFVKGDATLADKFNVGFGDADGDGVVRVDGEGDTQEDADGNVNNEVVTDAAVYMGPFMEVMLQSSSTKMVIGAACVTGRETSSTAFYMDNVSKVVVASDASIFIEGGFGKLTLQTSDYAGAVSAIGDAGDQADIDADGLVAIVEGVGLLGANPYLAVDLQAERSLNSLEVLTGGTIDMGGLSAAIDVELDNAAGVIGIGSWDLGLDYAMGDMAVSFVVDSANDWGMSASMDVAGFGVDATIYNKALEDHKKSGLFYDVSASTSLNGCGLSLGVDQDLQPTVSLSKSMGGLSIYAGYDAGDEGGKVGATLSF